MTTRVLTPSEWPRLVGTGLADVALPPAALVLAVEDDAGAIVGCWALLPCWHVEGLWVAPAHRRRASVVRRLWAGVRSMGAAVGVREVLTNSMTAEIDQLLAHVGARQVPGGAYVVPLTRPRGHADLPAQVM